MSKKDPKRKVSETQEKIQASEKDRVRIDKNIYYKKSQRKYYVVFYYGVDQETGKPIKAGKSYASKREAIAAHNAFEREKQIKTVIVPKKDTLFTCIDDYIQAKEVAGCEKATLAEYHKFKKHLHEYGKFENKPVQSIAMRDIVDYLRYLDTDKGVAANTRRKHYDFLKSVLNKGAYDLMITTNPIAYLDPSRKTPTCAKAMLGSLAAEVLARAAGTKVPPSFSEILLEEYENKKLSPSIVENTATKNECITVKSPDVIFSHPGFFRFWDIYGTVTMLKYF